MKKLILSMLVLLISGCSNSYLPNSSIDNKPTIGILLSDTGLGDESFNDAAFRGLEKARDELGILFDYREAPDGNFEQALTELVEQKHHLIIGLGFSIQEALENVAKKYPDQQFVLIDGKSDLKNIVSITYKEYEGSFLVGMVAAMTTKSNKLGFIGGMDVPVVNHFKAGFIQGAQYINPKIKVDIQYANSFSNAELGSEIASTQIDNGADFIYPAAGFTGFGALHTAQEKRVWAAGVDSDQYFVAEKAVVTSMLKNIDITVYQLAELLIEKGKIEQHNFELGLAENGVGLAEIRRLDLTPNQVKKLEETKNQIINGEITVSNN